MAEPSPPTPQAGLRIVLVLPLLGGWTALLAIPGLLPEALPWLLRFAPLGFLAVFAFPDRGFWFVRALAVGLPAFALGLLSAFVALSWKERALGAPGPSDLLLPALAVVLGVVVGLAWRRGLTPVLLLPLKLAFLGMALAALGAAALLLVSEAAPAASAPRPLTAEDRRQLLALLRDKDPRTIPVGESRSLQLSPGDLERLCSWLLPLLAGPTHARTKFLASADERLRVETSLRLPLLPRWLNLRASLRPRIESGRLELGSPRLQLGRFAVPDPLLDALAPLVAAAVRAERPLRAPIAAFREARIDGTGVRLSYGRFALPRSAASDVLFGPPPPERPTEDARP